MAAVYFASSGVESLRRTLSLRERMQRFSCRRNRPRVTYVTYYAGLASAMIALVFLYYNAWIFVYGGELNAAIARVRELVPAS